MSLRLLSGDPPRSMVLGALLIAVALLLLAAPFLFPGPKSLAVAAKILVFIVLVASYDLLLGYTGIVSFAHTMFFGIGAYGVAIASVRLEPGWTAVLAGAAGGLAVSLAFALLIGLASLRVRAIFYAMITLAVAAAFQTLVSQLSDLTGGEDGLNFKVPQMLRPAFRPLSEPLFGVTVDGRIITYYLIAAVAVVLFLLLLRIVNSPFGRVLQAIRENPFRAEAIGYRTVLYRSLSNLLAAAFATLAGALYALWLRYNGPDTSLSFEIMLNILLMLVIGGMGTMYGAVIGASLFVFAQSYLQDGLHLIHETVAGVRRWRCCSSLTAGCCGWASCSWCRCITFRRGSRDGSGNWRNGDKPARLSRRRLGGHGSRSGKCCCLLSPGHPRPRAARYFTRLRTSSTLRFTSSTRRCRSSILRLLESALLFNCDTLRDSFSSSFFWLSALRLSLSRSLRWPSLLRPPSPCLRSSADSFCVCSSSLRLSSSFLRRNSVNASACSLIWRVNLLTSMPART